MFAIGLGLMANPSAMHGNTPSFRAVITMIIAAAVVMLLAALVITPIFVRLRAVYLVGNTQFGTAPFTVTLTLKRLYHLIGRSARIHGQGVGKRQRA